MYAPYKDRINLWDRLDISGILSLDNMVLAGDLNLTLHSFENWGTFSPVDPLGDYFLELTKKIS